MSIVIALATASFFVLVYLIEDVTQLHLLKNTETSLIDLRFRLRGPREPAGDVAIVAIDSKSVEQIGRFPWPRTVHAELIDQLREWGTSAVVFDVLFTERQGEREAKRLDRIEQALPEGAEAALLELAAAKEEVLVDQRISAAMERTFDDDAALTVMAYDFILPEDVRQVRQLGKVLSADEEQTILDIGSYLSRDQNVPYLRWEPTKLALGIRPVITELADWSVALGYVNPIFDGDGALRRERIFVIYCPGVKDAWEAGRDPTDVLLDPEQRVQAMMPLAVAGVASHLRLTVDQLVLDLEANELRFPSSAEPDAEERVVELNADDGTMMIDFYGAGRKIPTYSFVDALNGQLLDDDGKEVGPEALAGKLVFVGMSDPGLTDFFTTPFTARLPGVEKHASTAANLLEGRQLRRHGDADLAVVLTALAVALIAGILVGNLGVITGLLSTGAIFLGWIVVSYRDFASDGLVWNWSVPLATLLVSGGLITAYRQIGEARARRQMEQRSEFLQQTFGRYLSDEVVAMLVDSPEGLTLGGEKRELTILMSDLRGFTALCERSSPEVVIRMLNVYLGKMADLVLKYQGTVDEFIGDAVLALFGAPMAREGDAQRAVACAIEMQQELLEVNAFFRSEGFSEVEMGVALNTGDVIVGNIGSERRSKYGVVGSNVNLTARIESYTVGGQVLISGATLEQAGDIVQVGDRVDVAAKGLSEPVPAFQVLGIGAPFDLKIPEIKEEFLDLSEAIDVRWAALSGKKLSDEDLAGKFPRISNLGADLECGEDLEALTNLKLTVYDKEGQQLEGDLYAKVVKRETPPGICPLRFTSTPPKVKKYLKKIRASSQQSTARPEQRRAGTMPLQVPDMKKEIAKRQKEIEKEAGGEAQ
ncbi:MAG: adenylate/guanylate cyclase domain-containing protein [bacterium]|nr:adenylate/guanylate cyclase domain-containing protein [bacterium]